MEFMSIPAEVKEMLDGPNYGHLTTLMSDGSPRNHVVWVWREDDRVVVATSPGNSKAKDMDRDPRVSISLINQEDPYQMAALRGRVVDVRPDDRLRLMDQIAHKYTSAPFPDRDISLVYYVIAITSAYERTLGGFVHRPAASTGAVPD
jgi:PPOX class probable F420-dependent enzyme